MTVTYPYSVNNGRSGEAPMWYVPTPANTLLDMDVPPVTAPYPQCDFYPPSYCQNIQIPFLNDQPAPNSTAALVQASNQAAAQMAMMATPAPTPAAASITGQSLSPITLVSPMPTITAPPAGSVVSNNIPAPVLPSFECGIANWVNSNPLLAALSAVAVYFFVAKGVK